MNMAQGPNVFLGGLLERTKLGGAALKFVIVTFKNRSIKAKNPDFSTISKTRAGNSKPPILFEIIKFDVLKPLLASLRDQLSRQ